MDVVRLSKNRIAPRKSIPMSAKTLSGYTADTMGSPKKYLIPTKAQSMNFEIKVIGIKKQGVDDEDFENDGLF